MPLVESPTMMATQEVDVVTIGAGEDPTPMVVSTTRDPVTQTLTTRLYHIATSKFYVDAHPQCRLTILEQDICPGGPNLSFGSAST